MIVKSLMIKEGNFCKNIEFSKFVNIIYSKKNTVGKTTLLRILLFALGYPIPNTKKMKFEKCEITCNLITHDGEYVINRNNDYLEVNHYSNVENYLLPDELYKFHSKIFNTNNLDILSNILGALYFDQEKGWTMLNRGTIIGNIAFNIEHLVRGLADIDCRDLENKLKEVESNLIKYKKLYNIAEYQNEIHKIKGDIVYDSYDEKLENKIAVLESEARSINSQLKNVNQVISNNKSFISYINKMGIRVKSKDGEIIPVNEDTIVDFSDFEDILKAKKRIITSDLNSIRKQIEELELNRKSNNGLFETENLLLSYENKVAKMDIDQIALEKIVNGLEASKTELKSKIRDLTRSVPDIIENIYKTVDEYSVELGLSEYISNNKDYIFTSDLKSLSGAVLHKLIFSFKLAYISEIQKKLDIKLPIILDSPSGREVEQINIDGMIEILKRDFNDNQIIIASINKYNFNDYKLIELNEVLIDEEVKNN